MKYLKGTLQFKLCFGGDKISLYDYCNMDWVGDYQMIGCQQQDFFFVAIGVIS